MESAGLEGSGEGGAQNEPRGGKKSTDGCQRQRTIQWELRGRDPSRFFRTKTKKRFKTPSPANPSSSHFSQWKPRGPWVPARVWLSPSLSALSLARALCSRPPRAPLPSPSSPPAPPSARPFPRLGSLAAARARAPLSSARGSALRLPGGWRRGARERGGAATLCSGSGDTVVAVAPETPAGRRAPPLAPPALLCRPPFQGPTCCLGRKLTSSPGSPGSPAPAQTHQSLRTLLLPARRAAVPHAACQLHPPNPCPSPPGHRVPEAWKAQLRPEGVESREPEPARGVGKGR